MTNDNIRDIKKDKIVTIEGRKYRATYDAEYRDGKWFVWVLPLL